ncbi:hypothetical protein KCU57_05160 [Xanthomonas translucens]|uniref:hypothetical protein n=1 Tax=Xanthomonas campestris pv. translucens TaxID=343 RepID=UPI001F33772C|nr:hypothetical protein [Xanthomonas translucens]UKE51710.1 hypothetical protein KCU57_05160 [Xanthomonas translucens]
MSNIDLNNPPSGHSFKVNVEKNETEAERAVRLTKDLLLFLFASVFIGVIGWRCLTALLDTTGKVLADDKTWAMSFLTEVGGALVGYLVRKQRHALLGRSVTGLKA